MTKPIPIIMSSMMAQANVLGLKRETRRAVGLEQVNKDPDAWTFYGWCKSKPTIAIFMPTDDISTLEVSCRYGPVGSVLWMRENWAVGKGYDGVKPRDLPKGTRINVWYGADGPYPEGAGVGRSAIHLPFHLARQFAQTHQIVAQRIQSITDEEAVNEGILRSQAAGIPLYWHYLDHVWVKSAKLSFMTLWLKINGPETWDANIWVWVVKYQHITKP